jgi:hypothetical protein
LSDRRRAKRQKSFLRGRIGFDEGCQNVDCIIHDLSDQGARLIHSSAIHVPNSFDLYVPKKNQRLKSFVRWRSIGQVGVAFDAQDERKATSETSDIERRLAQIESELASLRQMVELLTRPARAVTGS